MAENTLNYFIRRTTIRDNIMYLIKFNKPLLCLLLCLLCASTVSAQNTQADLESRSSDKEKALVKERAEKVATPKAPTFIRSNKAAVARARLKKMRPEKLIKVIKVQDMVMEHLIPIKSRYLPRKSAVRVW